MKKSVLLAAVVLANINAAAQGTQRPQAPQPKYVFTTVDSVAISPVKNQSNAGTCWAYSGVGFLESELIRTKKKVFDLSEMYIVFNSYMERAEKAVRTSGDVSFSQGGSLYDVTYAIDHYGMVPDSEMPAGVMYGKTLSNHSELTAIGDPMVQAIAKGRLRGGMQVSPDGEQLWKKAVRAVHEVYLGKCPEKFTFEGKEYTPKTFGQYLGLKGSDYANLTSFTHHPYSVGEFIGEGFAIEVQDNWRWGLSLNLELDDLMRIIEEAIKAGYSIHWASDVSEPGFSRQGVVTYNDEKAEESKVGSDQAHWVGADPTQPDAKQEQKEVLPKPQKVVTPAERQAMYDGKTTTDDHGMQIFGIAKDQWGNKYYMVKNSWGITGKYDGIWYVSEAYVRAQTIDLVFHKDAVPAAIKAKLGIR